MTLGEEMAKVSLSEIRKNYDPVSEATKKGRVPTLGEVKRSLKVKSPFVLNIDVLIHFLQTLVKTLINTISNMDALPSA